MTNVLPRITNVDRVGQAVQTLKNYIISNNLAAGTELPSETEMASQLGLSKFSMREALRVAQAQGLVDIGRGRKTRVASPKVECVSETMSILLRSSDNALLELTEARQGMECQVARLAAERATDDDISELKRSIVEMEEHIEDLEYCTGKDMEFHEILAKASGNRIFEMMLAPLAELLKHSREKAMKKATPGHALSGHKKIVAAIEKRDSNEAERAMVDHLMMAEQDLSD